MTYEIHSGEVIDVLRTLPDNSADSTVCDPPYGLGSKQPTADDLISFLQGKSLNTNGDFMGYDWQVPSVSEWKEVFRILKPGSPVLAFGGSRTFDLIALGLRAAGFEIKDSLIWNSSQGMPKPASTTDKFLDDAAGAVREEVGPNPNARAAQETYSLDGEKANFRATYNPVTLPSTDLAKRWAGYGHALAPSHEPVVVARKPLDGGIAENIRLWDVCGLNIAGCRLGTTGGTRKVNLEKYRTEGNALEGSVDGSLNGGIKEAIAAGRWAPNVLISHSQDCVLRGTKLIRGASQESVNKERGKRPGGFLDVGSEEGSSSPNGPTYGDEEVEDFDCAPYCAVRMFDEQSGVRPSTLAGRADPGSTHANPGANGGASWFGGGDSRVYADSGGCSRFFATFSYLPGEVAWNELAKFKYCSKVSGAERDFGLDDFPIKSGAEATRRKEGSVGIDRPQSGAGRGGGHRNSHPAVKPIRVMEWLAKLTLPPPRVNGKRVCLVPWSGSGSEMVGALRAGWDHVIGIERDEKFIDFAHARIDRWMSCPTHLTVEQILSTSVTPDPRQASLF